MKNKVLFATLFLIAASVVGFVVLKVNPERVQGVATQDQSGTVFLNGKRLVVPVTFQWTSTTLICNDIDIAPGEPYVDEPWPAPPVDFTTATGLYLKQYTDCCLTKGPGCFASCLDQLETSLEASPFVTRLVMNEETNSLVVHGSSGQSLGVDLIHEPEHLATVQEARTYQKHLKLTDSNPIGRKVSLQTIENEINETIDDGGLLIVTGLHYLMTVPPGDEEVLTQIDSICSGGLSDEEKIDALADVIGHTETAELLVQNYTE